MVRSLPDSLSIASLRQYFKQFGSISEIFRAAPKKGCASLNWGCVTFTDEASVIDVLRRTSHVIREHELEVVPFLRTKPKFT